MMTKSLRKTLLWSGAALGMMSAANALVSHNTPVLAARLGGGFNRYAARYGDMAYFIAGEGAPLLLLHDLRPGNFCAEWENNFSALAGHFTVYAPDFLGWGLSDKPRHILRRHDYVEQVLHCVADVISASESTPVAVIASGSSSLFALLAIQQAPELFSKIVLIGPTIQTEYFHNGKPTNARQHFLFKLLTLPIVGQSAMNFVTQSAHLQAQAEQLLFDQSNVTPSLVTRMHIAAHQPGAALALATQNAGRLGGRWEKAWSTLQQPALLVWGRQALPHGYETSPGWLALNPRADLEVFDNAKWLPHIERAAECNQRITQWLMKT